MRVKALSDPRVISAVNEFTVPVPLNITKHGFPAHKLPALTHVERIFNASWRSNFGFASCLLLDSDGKLVLGSSSYTSKDRIEEMGDSSIMFSPQRYLTFIVESLERFKKLQEIRKLPGFQQIGAWQTFFAELLGNVRSAVDNMAAFQRKNQ